jgi:hypothetical protein
LTDHVLAHKDEILEDALGLAYTSEIDAMYDQMGARLTHLNQLLSNLPVEDEEEIETPIGRQRGERDDMFLPEDDLQASDENFHEHHGPQTKTPAPHLSPSLALPGPSEILQLAGPTPTVSFQRFATRIFVGDLEGAGEILSELFELDDARARKCAQVFYDGVRNNPEVIGKAAQLRRDLQAGNFNSSLALLHDCFGLQGVESISVMQTLRARMERTS